MNSIHDPVIEGETAAQTSREKERGRKRERGCYFFFCDKRLKVEQYVYEVMLYSESFIL